MARESKDPDMETTKPRKPEPQTIKPRKWTTEETNALLNGVERHGAGKWDWYKIKKDNFVLSRWSRRDIKKKYAKLIKKKFEAVETGGGVQWKQHCP